MIRFLILFLFSISLFAAKVETFRWSNGQTYLSFLQSNKLPTKELYYNIDEDDQQLTEDIISNVHYHILRGKNNEISQVLIPVSDEIQIHIYKYDDDYFFEAIPIISQTRTEAFTFELRDSIYNDIVNETGSIKLASMFISSFKHTLNFKTGLKKGNTIAMIYEQKYRLGKPFSIPSLKVGMIEMNNKQNFIYLNSDEKFYNELGQELEGFLLATPVRGAKISSLFTKRRFHPILRKYRAHLGMDYAASGGTPIMASGDGIITYQGYTRGYGNVTKIQHTNDYLTLYAHQKSFRKGIRRGMSIKKGQVIGYIGNSGLSTGTHLHFGLYKNGNPVDPQKVVQIAAKKLSNKERESFFKLKKNYDLNIKKHIQNKTKFNRVPYTDNSCYFFST